MRTSSYNILARVDEQEGLYAILNAYTQAFDIINTEVYNYLRVNGENGEITEETRDTLVKRGYLTSLSQKDEQELVKQLLDRAYDETRFKKIVSILYFRITVILDVFIVMKILF